MRPTTKATRQTLRSTNEQLVLQAIVMGQGQNSRADIARETGLTRATVSEICADLIDRGLVYESGKRAGSGAGKPALTLDLDRRHHVVLAAHLLADRVVCTCILLTGQVDELVELFVGDKDAEDVVVAGLGAIAAERPERVLAVGLAVPHAVDIADEAPDERDDSANGATLPGRLNHALNAPVYTLDDGSATAMYEGAVSERELPSLAVLRVNHEVRAGILIDGHLLRGGTGRSGDLGHLTVAPAPNHHWPRLDAVVTLPALLSGLDEHAVRWWAAGRRNRAVDELEERVSAAAAHLASASDVVASIVDVAEVVIDGSITVFGKDLLETIRQHSGLGGGGGELTIRYSTFGPDTVVLGAATYAFQRRIGAIWSADHLRYDDADQHLTLVKPEHGGYSMAKLSTTRRYVSAAATAALVLAACSSDDGDAEGSDSNDSASGGDMTLEVWTHEFEPLQTALTEKWIPEFEEANPGVKVNLTSIPFAGVVSYDAKLLSALSSGGGPDVWDMGDWNYSVFAENGFLEPIDPETFGYADDAELIDSFLPGTTDAMVHDGKLLGLFSEYNTLNLFYNKEVFADAGLDEPSADTPMSWEEVAELSEAMRVENGAAVERIGFQFGFFANFRSPQWYAQNYYTFLRQSGQEDIYVDGEPAGNTDAATAAFQWIYDFTHTYQAYDPNFLNNWFADVPQGRAGMVQAGTWYPAAAMDNNKDFEFGVVPNPVVDPNDPSTYHNVSWLWGWSVNANSDDPKKQMAQKFLAFMLGKKGETEQAADWFERLGYMQPSNAFLESDAYQSALDESPWLQLWVDAHETYDIKSVPHSYDEAGSALVRAIDRVVYDGASAQEAAEQLQAELERLG